MDTASFRPELDEKGLAPHGSNWGARNHFVLRAVSRGPGIPVEVRPVGNGAPPVRVISGAGTAEMRGSKLYTTPATTPAGQEYTVVVEV